jgi:hypothetical protein
MFKITASLLILLICMQCFCNSFKYDDLFEGDSGAEDEKELEREVAEDFLKRTLFHPGHTKNEGIYI